MKNAGHLLNIYTDGGLGHEPRPPPSAPPLLPLALALVYRPQGPAEY